MLASYTQYGFLIVSIVHLMQSLTYKERSLKLYLFFVNVVLLSLSGPLAKILGTSDWVYYGCIGLLLFNALLRSFAHFMEPMPIGVLDNRMPNHEWFFSDIKPQVGTIYFLGGLSSELNAGLPSRLLNVMLLLLAEEYFGLKFSSMNLDELRGIVKKIEMNGWGAYRQTQKLFKCEKSDN
jgi:hypothetical protein